MTPLRLVNAALLLLAVALATTASAQSIHFKPADHLLGDVHPYFEKGVCYLYYLKPGNYQSALVRSSDLLHWEEIPLTHAPVQNDDWMSPYYVLGVFRDEQAGLYRSFYGHKEGRMVSSISRDLLHWECAPKTFSIPPETDYVRRRDPYVFWIPESQEYGCVMTTQMKGIAKEKAGAVSYATSKDLQTWTSHGQILYPKTHGEPECPQMFKLGQHWYLLASIYDRAVGQPVYWRAPSPTGPWSHTPQGVLDGKDLCAAQIAMDGETPVLLGWIPAKASRPGNQTWGGHLALPRTLHPEPDGTLSVRLHSEVGKRIRGASMPLTEARDRLDITCSVKQSSKDKLGFDIDLKNADKLKARVLVPAGKSVLRIEDATGQPWSEIPVQLPTDSDVPVRIIVESDMIEVFLADRYSLAARLPDSIGEVTVSTSTPHQISALQTWQLQALQQ